MSISAAMFASSGGKSAGKRVLAQVAALEKTFEPLADEELRKQSLSLRYRARSGQPLEKLLPEAFALVRTAALRTLNMRHYDVQILGGMLIHHRSIAEMQTGEGKTLTATLPLYLAALTGKGAHLATANDYLARRDAEWMQPIFELLGQSVGIVEAQTPQQQRRAAYACDVTYGTAKEFGFDFLRDRLAKRQAGEAGGQLMATLTGQSTSANTVQRTLNYVIIDEADSILIDEARTPLIVSAISGGGSGTPVALYQWAAQVAERFLEKEDFEYEHEKRAVTLTTAGRRKLRGLPHPAELNEVGMLDLYENMELAIKARRDFHLDQHYVVREGEIVIIDEFTGRAAEGRKWRAGVHQAIEAKEGVEVTADTGEAARVTVQDLFLRYDRIGGMTGTAANSARELKKIYKTRVVQVPTNRPPRRKKLPDRVFGTSAAKWAAIVEEVEQMHQQGRPVLIGTRSIDKSEQLSRLLSEHRLPHKVLNARHVAAEADIVAQAGQSGKITVATNMAGRGTDIKLGEGVLELGGMHVVCTELHESARIDRQLIGRCGRQGDPGSYRQYLALDDEILLGGFGPAKAAKLKKQGEAGGSFDGLASLFYRAQAKVEREHFRQRKLLLYVESERHKMHQQMGQDPYLDSTG